MGLALPPFLLIIFLLEKSGVSALHFDIGCEIRLSNLSGECIVAR